MNARAAETRNTWLAVLEKHRRDFDMPGGADHWCPSLDCASRDEIRAIQDEKVAAVTPFLYENSPFYRARFDRLGLVPTDIRSIDDLVANWPVVDKQEMMADVTANPPYGTYTTMTEQVWGERGWMLFSSSGSTGVPRVFRYSQIDREQWAWANARAMHAMGFRKGDSVLMATGYGPHVYAWGVQMALEKMGLPVIPGGGMDARARAHVIDRFKPTVLLGTPSYALHLGRVMQDQGFDPAASTINKVFVGGEPAMGIPATRQRIEDLWGARLVEFYGCTEAAPSAGGYSCTARPADGDIFTHVMDDLQYWEVVDPDSKAALSDGERGLTAVTNLNSEASPQLRFLVGDYTIFDRTPCSCGRTHSRAMGGFAGRADDLINLRGIKMFPTQIEAAVRAVAGIGDEYEIHITRNPDGLDVMTVRVEHVEDIADQVAAEIRTRCEVRVGVEVLTPGTLPKTEFKARRVRDERG